MPIDPFVNSDAFNKTFNNFVQKNLEPIKFDGLSQKQNSMLNNYNAQNATAIAAKLKADQFIGPRLDTFDYSTLKNTKTTKKKK
jgi:hypothetical protein